jgi:oligopeptide/dipeptide ABC transporter ATP-binding protein
VSDDALLEVENLTTDLLLGERTRRVLNGVSFKVRRGEALSIVGESGAGKTILALSMIGHPPRPNGRIASGTVRYRGVDLLTSPDARRIVGRSVGVVFENPAASLDPCYRIGTQIAETITAHEGCSGEEARRRAVELLGLVGLPDPRSAFDAYPHQFSGGMQQRAVIAIALACNPDLLIADNPTSSLDVTIQAQIVRLIEDLRRKFGLTLVWITHNLGLVARLCDRMAIMYAGQIVETGPVRDVIDHAAHPYTQALMLISKGVGKRQRMTPLPGTAPAVAPSSAGCLFAPRCPLAEPACRSGRIPLRAIGAEHEMRCIGVPWRRRAGAAERSPANV